MFLYAKGVPIVLYDSWNNIPYLNYNLLYGRGPCELSLEHSPKIYLNILWVNSFSLVAQKNIFPFSHVFTFTAFYSVEKKKLAVCKNAKMKNIDWIKGVLFI